MRGLLVGVLLLQVVCGSLAPVAFAPAAARRARRPSRVRMSFEPQELPPILELAFEPGSVKLGGLKTYLTLFLIGGVRGPDPFQTRASSTGLTAIFVDNKPNAEIMGALDVDIDADRATLTVSRMDPARLSPYPGEQRFMLDIVDALLDLDRDDTLEDAGRLFKFTPESRAAAAVAAKARAVEVPPSKAAVASGQLAEAYADSRQKGAYAIVGAALLVALALLYL